MKKTLLLLSALVMSAASAFAQWTQPVPKFVPMADDGETEQYLYNVEAGAFFIAGNDWQTRASVNDTIGAKVKMAQAFYDDEKTEPAGTWIIWNYVPKFKEFRKAFADNPQAIWTDNNNGANCDSWVVTTLGENKYEITNPNAGSGKLGMAKLMEGAANTRLWLLDPNDEETWVNNDGTLKYEGPCTTWAFVTPDEYDALIPRLKVYAAAMSLKAALEDEEAKLVDVTPYKAVYDNTNSTVEELEAAEAALKAAIVEAKGNMATPENPIDMTSSVPSNDFENGFTGWTSTTGCQNNTTATNRTVDADYPGTPMTGRFWENWDPNPFSGKMHTTLEGLPKGVYQLQLDAFANGSDGENNAWVFANNDSVRTGGTNTYGETDIELSNKVATFTVYGLVGEDGKLEIGLTQPTKSANWIGIDNAKLTYYGAGLESYKMWFAHLREVIINDMNKLVDEDTKYNKSQKAAFEAALTVGDNATTVEEMLEAAKVLTDVAQETIASIKAYQAYIAQRNEIEEYMGEHELNGELADLLSDYISEEPMEDEAWPNGNYGYIMENCQLSTEEIIAETALLHQMLLDAINSSLQPGQVADFLVNPLFTEGKKGWTGNGTAGGLDIFPSVEVYDSTVDIYQEVEGVPDGIYSLSCNAFYRPGDNGSYDGTEISPVYLYMNVFETPVQNICADAMPEDKAEDLVNCYLVENTPIEGATVLPGTPNSLADYNVEGFGYVPNSMTGASVAFKADRYKQTVYGIVEGGKMKIGLTSKGKSIHWVLWSNFVLVYEGINDAAVDAIAEVYVNNANAVLEANQDNMSNPGIEAFAAAIAAIENADDAQEKYDAVKALNDAIVASNENVAAVAKFIKAQEAMNEAAEVYGETAAEDVIAAYSEMNDVDYMDMTTEEMLAAIAKMNEIAGKLRIPGDAENASDAAPVDMTQVIVNPAFDENTDGWSGDKAAYDTGNSTVAEFYNNDKFDMYQEFYGMPAGTYELKVQGFYRQGSAVDDYKAYTGEKESKQNVKLYANDSYILFPCASSVTVESKDAITDWAKCGEGVDGDLWIPNRLWGAESQFEAGHYWNSLIFAYDGQGALRIGIKKEEKINTDWTPFDNFQLIYYGANSTKEPNGVGTTGIAAITPATNVTATAVYNAAGAQVRGLQKGLNIVKMSDGSVRKIYVK